MRQKSIAFILLLYIFSFNICLAAEITGSVISGQFIASIGKPMSYAKVYFYNQSSGPPPSPEKYWRIPDVMTTADNEGRFVSDLSPGSYYIQAVKSETPLIYPFPQVGDLFSTYIDSSGQPVKFTVKNGLNNLGVITGALPYAKSSEETVITAIQGVVTTGDGKPVRGALVFAYTSDSQNAKPVFVSSQTGNDGKYILRLFGGGKHFITAAECSNIGLCIKEKSILTEDITPVLIEYKQIKNGINIKLKKFSSRINSELSNQ